MPMYDYQCTREGCRKVFERFYKIDEKPVFVECDCGGEARSILSASCVLGDEMPAWMRHPEALGCLQNSSEKPIETHSEYNRYLKQHGIAEVSVSG